MEHNPDSGILPRMDGATTPPPGHDAATVLEDAGATAWTSAGMTDLHGDISRMFAHPSEAGHLLLAASVGSIVAVDWDNGTQVDASDTVMTDDDEWQGGGFTSDGAEHVLATKNGGLVLLTRPAGGQWQWTTLQGSFYGITVGAGAGGKPLVYAPEGVTDYSSVTAPVFDSAPGGGLTPPEMISWAYRPVRSSCRRRGPRARPLRSKLARLGNLCRVQGPASEACLLRPSYRRQGLH